MTEAAKAVTYSIFLATDACRRSFEDCLAIRSLMDHEWAENRLADFNLWVAGVGASAKRRASLDERLALEPEVRAVVTNLLITLKVFVEKCKELGSKGDNSGEYVDSASTPANDLGIGENTMVNSRSSAEPMPRSFSPWSDISSCDSENERASAITSTITLSKSPLDEAIKSTEAILDQLAQLAVAIRRSGTTSRLQKADRSFHPDDHSDLQNLREHLNLILLTRSSDIEDRRKECQNTLGEDRSVNFGVDATHLNPVQKRLVDANLRRRNRFIYAQGHATRLAARRDSPRLDPVADYNWVNQLVNETPRPISEPTITQKQNIPAEGGLELLPGVATDTTASAVGTVIPLKMSTPSEQAMTQVSSTGSKLTYPHPPKIEEGLNSFKCPCCCQIFPAMFSERRRWRKHIAEDLCPYTCPINNCPRPEVLYITRETWMSHVFQEHTSSQHWECFACDGTSRFFNVEEFRTHTRDCHRETISEVQIETLVDVCSRKTPPDITSCPLCPWADDLGGNIDHKALLDHVAEHIHSFSLRSLPWTSATNEEGKPRFDHSVEKVRTWFTGWPIAEGGQEYHPVYIKHNTQKSGDYFRQNEYFAEVSECSSLAQTDSHASDRDSEGMASLHFSSSEDSGVLAQPSRASSEYSHWVWSPEHQRFYCWRHNEDGVVEYQWSSPASQEEDGEEGEKKELKQEQAAPQEGPQPSQARVCTTEDETLDPRYKRVSLRSQPIFFCLGRVFRMLWTEPAGRVGSEYARTSSHFSIVKYGETAYNEIRRFVVIRNKGSFSQCVPIHTYRRQAATKIGIIVEDHAVIYIGDEFKNPPELLPGEGITKQALRVITDGNETLDIRSRINFGKTYTVEHNVKVLNIGIIAPEHLSLLENYWKWAHS